MVNAALNDVWVRILENATKGIGFALLSIAFLVLSLHRELHFRRTLVLLSVCFAAFSWAGFEVASTLYRTPMASLFATKHHGVAWAQGGAAMAATVLSVLVVGGYPRLLVVLTTWSQLHRASDGKMDDLSITKVTVKPLWRLRRRRSKGRSFDGAAST